MMFPECLSVDIKEVHYNPKTKDITYECADCHDIFIMSAESEVEITRRHLQAK